MIKNRAGRVASLGTRELAQERPSQKQVAILYFPFVGIMSFFLLGPHCSNNTATCNLLSIAVLVRNMGRDT